MADDAIIGRRRPRPDAPDKVTGRACYIQEVARPGMLWGRIKRSPLPHARILRVDASRAARLPGVAAVLTAADLPDLRIGFLRDQPVLKRGKVRRVGDEVAAVAAIDPDVAARALELIDVEYEELPAVFSPEAALEGGAPLVHEQDAAGRPVASNLVPLPWHHVTGDPDAARRACRFLVEGEYSSPLVQQACLGTAGCVAELDARGNLTVWTRTQIPFLAQRDFLRALEAIGLADRAVRVIVPALGGAFGTGLDTHPHEYLAILLAWKAGRPVKIQIGREEEFAFLAPRQPARIRVAQGCDADGRLLLRDVEVLQDNGAYVSWGATYPSVMMLPATSLYRVEAVRFAARSVYTNNPYAQAMRGYGAPEAIWAIESNLDDLAAAAGIDPLELRLRNRNEAGDVTAMGARITTCGLGECLAAVERRLGWRERRGRAAAGAPGRRRGVGMAAFVHVGGSGRIYRSDGGGVDLRLDDHGHVYVSCGGVEMGQGLHAALAATVGEALGVAPERVVVNPTDTATCPWDVGTHASRGAFVACNAALRAAADLRARLFALAAEVYPDEVGRSLGGRAPPGEIAALLADPAALVERFVLRDGGLWLRGAPDDPALRLELGRLVRALHFRGDRGQVLAAHAHYEPPSELPDWKRGFGNLSATYSFGAQGVEVEVDEETGDVRILRLVAAHDVGRALCPQELEGQLHGGIAQAVGWTLYEQLVSERGRVQNPSFTDYKIPTAVEMGFPIELELIETNDPAGPFGAKGVGEQGIIPTAAAIGNAIRDALGVRLRDLPLTPEKVLRALEEKRCR